MNKKYDFCYFLKQLIKYIVKIVIIITKIIMFAYSVRPERVQTANLHRDEMMRFYSSCWNTRT